MHFNHISESLLWNQAVVRAAGPTLLPLSRTEVAEVNERWANVLQLPSQDLPAAAMHVRLEQQK